MRTAVLVLALCVAGALALAGPHRIRQHKRPGDAAGGERERDHDARAEQIMSELEAGDDSLLEKLEHSVDAQLEHTKRELAKVTDFRNRATAALRSQLADWAAGNAKDSPEAERARALIEQSDQLNAAAGGDAADAEENASDAEVEARALAEGEAAAAAEDDSAEEAAEEEAVQGDSADEAEEEGQSPVDELLALDAQELSTRAAVAGSAERFAAVREARVQAGATEAEVDAQLDADVSALKLNLSALHDRRAVLLRHTRLHPSALLHVGTPKPQRTELLRADRDRLTAQLQSAAVVYSDVTGASGAADPAAEHMRALGASAGHGAAAKQTVAAWISLIDAELADSA